MRIVRALLILLTLIVCLPIAAVGWLMPTRRLRERYLVSARRGWARAMLWLLRVHVTVDPPGARYSGGAMYVANHTGYLDILVMTRDVPGRSVSREGIPWWPIVGQLAAMSGALFADRRNRGSLGRLVARVRRTLRGGASIILFPEGTSTDGSKLLHFKTPLLAAAEERDGERFPVCPVVIRYLTLGGAPIDASNRDRVYWYGEAGLIGHAWRMLKTPGIDVRVRPLPQRIIEGRRQDFAVELREEMAREYENLGTAS